MIDQDAESIAAEETDDLLDIIEIGLKQSEDSNTLIYGLFLKCMAYKLKGLDPEKIDKEFKNKIKEHSPYKVFELTMIRKWLSKTQLDKSVEDYIVQ